MSNTINAQMRAALQAIADCCEEDHAARDYASRQTEIRGIARAALAAAEAAQAQPEQCYCDRMGLGEPGVSCGDCPTRDYKQVQPVAVQPAPADGRVDPLKALAFADQAAKLAVLAERKRNLALCAALADACDLLDGWITTKCPARYKAEHKAHLAKLRSVLTAKSDSALVEPADKAKAIDLLMTALVQLYPRDVQPTDHIRSLIERALRLIEPTSGETA